MDEDKVDVARHVWELEECEECGAYVQIDKGKRVKASWFFGSRLIWVCEECIKKRNKEVRK